MTKISENSFLCPFCGEQILKSAKLCRFCKHSVCVDVFIEHIPENTNLGEIARQFSEKGPKNLFPTFGALRKKLESRGLFARDVKPDDMEKMADLFDQFGITVLQKNPTGTTKSNHVPINSLVLLFVIFTVGTVLFFYVYKPKQSAFSSSAPAVTDSSGGALIGDDPNVQSRTVEMNNNQPPLSNQSHANIESLLISTATILINGGSGSAFFVSREGHLISNQHVTKSQKEVDVLTFDKKRYKGKVIRSQDFYDLSLIKIDSKDYPPLRLGDATKLHPGDTVWTIGAPHGLEFSVTKGIASFVGRNVGGKSFVQADVAINPGNSGGPMINDQGEVIGINNFIIKQTVGLNFAIPVNYLYSGTDPILDNVVQTTPDTGTMAIWRSWEKENPQRTATTESEPESTPNSSNNGPNNSASASEINDLNKELKAAEQKLSNNQKKLDAALDALNRKIATINSQYSNSQTVSDQEKIGQGLRKLQIEYIDLEIDKLEDLLNYNKSAVTIMQKAKQLSISNPTLTQHYTDELQKLSQSKMESENLKASKEQQRIALQAQQY